VRANQLENDIRRLSKLGQWLGPELLGHTNRHATGKAFETHRLSKSHLDSRSAFCRSPFFFQILNSIAVSSSITFQFPFRSSQVSIWSSVRYQSKLLSVRQRLRDYSQGWAGKVPSLTFANLDELVYLELQRP